MTTDPRRTLNTTSQQGQTLTTIHLPVCPARVHNHCSLFPDRSVLLKHQLACPVPLAAAGDGGVCWPAYVGGLHHTHRLVPVDANCTLKCNDYHSECNSKGDKNINNMAKDSKNHNGMGVSYPGRTPGCDLIV